MAATDTSRTRPRALSVVAALLFISSLILHLLHFFSVGPSVPIDGPEDAGYRQRYSVLGSRPPRCINKCNACKPCLPTLVPQRQPQVKKTISSRDDNGDGGYYLLAWKCRCRGKIFQP